MLLGAQYGDVYGERELGWGLSFKALQPPAAAWMGYSRWWDGTYHSGVAVDDGAGRRWTAEAGGPFKPLPRKP